MRIRGLRGVAVMLSMVILGVTCKRHNNHILNGTQDVAINETGEPTMSISTASTTV